MPVELQTQQQKNCARKTQNSHKQTRDSSNLYIRETQLYFIILCTFLYNGYMFTYHAHLLFLQLVVSNCNQNHILQHPNDIFYDNITCHTCHFDGKPFRNVLDIFLLLFQAH
jgi:hypothetical protein